MIRLCLLEKIKLSQLRSLMFLLIIISWQSINAKSVTELTTLGQLACNDDIQISLDEDCRATITPDMVLEGTGIVNSAYTVIVRDWVTNAIIDLDPVAPFAQIGPAQIGRHLQITIREVAPPYNSCWGRAFIEDKLAPDVICPANLTVTCMASIAPTATGTPTVIEDCGTYELTYKDVVLKGSCALGYERIINRYWVAVDQSGNRDTCLQTIRVNFVALSALVFPKHFDGLTSIAGHTHMLSCDSKVDRAKDVSAHILSAPTCVDGYLLDSVRYRLDGTRRPKTLGWNCLDSGPYTGHPNPKHIYYPKNGTCWNDSTHVMWEGTGEPSAAGCSNIAVTYSDLRIDIAKPGCNAGPVGCYKLLRKWTLLDWCTGAVLDSNQIIKVMDTIGPKVLYPDSLNVSTDVWKCEGRWEVPPAWIVDNCSNEVHYSVRVTSGTVLGNEISGFIVVNLPLGIQNAYILAEDCCGNITEKKVVINVVDDIAPTAVCDQKTVVTLTGNLSPGLNYSKIYAESFDNGSHDNCAQHLFFKVIRMDELDGTPNGTSKPTTICAGANGDDDANVTGAQAYFDDYVAFCCADVGRTVRVVFRVFDVDPGAGPVRPSRFTAGPLKGRFNDCMVEVEVQDKSAPSVVAPPDIVVSCMFWFDVTRLTDPRDSTFGKVVNDLAWRTKVKTKDIVCKYYCASNALTGYPGFISGLPAHLQPAPNVACNYFNTLYNPSHPDNKYELVWGFDGYVLSTCGTTPTITVTDRRECGQGRIERKVSANGPNGSIITATQTIWIVDCNPFYISSTKCDLLDDIAWPDCAGVGTHVNGCGANTDPDVIGRPVIQNGADDNCALIAIEHFDETFTIEPDACFKILRRWVIIDWCQYDPNISATNGRWEHTQVIKVSDIVAPVVTCNVGPCEPAVINTTTGTCVGHIRLSATATDSCSPADWLVYEYKIDAFNNGTIDYSVGRLTRRGYALGEIPTVRNNPYADNRNNPFDASGTYPIGIHKITWYIEDGCGNIGTCSTLFQVKDCKAPTPYCLTGIITVPMPSSGCVDVWAKDLNAGSYDNCTPQNKLKFYFNGDPAKTSLRVCCADFVRAHANDELVIPVEMWVEDEEGNKDYCKTTVIIQDNLNTCPNSGTNIARIIGELHTEDGAMTTKGSTDLYSNGALSKNMITNSNGKYSFLDLSMGSDYMVKPERKDDVTNGVTTADIVKIQKHILGIESLPSAYKLIAADANNSGSITAADMSEIRKVILGVYNEFKNVNSWVFVPANHVFADPTSPWKYPSLVNTKLDKEVNTIDFISVKIGDVNNSANASNLTNSSSRTNGEKLVLEIDAAKLNAGQTYKMDVRSSNFKNINGYQFTLNFDSKNLQFNKVIAGQLSVNESNFGTQRISEGMITTSWNANAAANVATNDVLFSIEFTVLNNMDISKNIAITSDITMAEAYNSNLDAMDVVLTSRNNTTVAETGVFELYQNTPNPFSKETVIEFRLAQASAATLTIYDLTGKVHAIETINGVKGLNSIKIDRSKLNGTGMYYYQLDADTHTATKRMIITE